MNVNLKPTSPEGERFVTAVEALLPRMREYAAQADQDNAMSEASFAMLQGAGITAAFVPQALGGFGVTSVSDWLAGIAALGRGDGSAAIALNMHLGVSRGMAQGYTSALASGRHADAAAAPLKAIAAGRMLICATATERGTDNLHPFTTATSTADGFVIEGHKMFVTMSPLASHIAMNLRLQDEDGDHLASTMLPIDTPGIEPQGDWDALGMRGSGSQSVKFNAVKVPAQSVRKLGPWGRWSTASLVSRTLGNLALVAAFFGIALHARELALEAAGKAKKLDVPIATSPGVQQTTGEMEIEVTRCRALLQQVGSDIDLWLAEAETTKPTLESAHELMQLYQSAKWSVNRGAIEIVSKAMDLAGGGGYVAGNPLTRLYRDVRAGPFMQPHAATDIRQYVGQVALGQYPES